MGLAACRICSNITPAIKYVNIVIPAKAGIQVGTGCRIKSGMTQLPYLVAGLITHDSSMAPSRFPLDEKTKRSYYTYYIIMERR